MKLVRRGQRTEDVTAEAIAAIVQERANAALHALREEIKKIPEIRKQKAKARVTETRWEHYITTLARKAFAGESLIEVTNEFNRLYVFPFREKISRH